jgi:hypothetical protein
MLTFLLKFTPRGILKNIVIVVFCLDALHFWRDSIDISVKLLLQDVVCALLLLYVPAIRRRSGAAVAPDLRPEKSNAT